MRELKARRYIIAFVLTIAIFSIGILLGVIVSTQRETAISKANAMQKLDYDSLQLQYLFLTASTLDKNCNAMLSALEHSTSQLESSREKLESYIDENDFWDYDALKKDYMLAEIRYWLFAKKANEICKRNNAAVLYFYSNEEDSCRDCNAQGLILTYLKEIFGDKLLIFSIDGDYSEQMIGILRGNYNVTEYPTIVINEDVYVGLQDKEDLYNLICGKYIEDCDDVSVSTSISTSIGDVSRESG